MRQRILEGGGGVGVEDAVGGELVAGTHRHSLTASPAKALNQILGVLVAMPTFLPTLQLIIM